LIKIALKRFAARFIDRRFLKFATIGGSGILVNFSILYTLTEYAGIHYSISSLVAIEVAVMFNFFLNDRWTWKDRQNGSRLRRMLRFHLAAGVSAFFGNWSVLVFTTETLGVHYLFGNLLGIWAGSLMNFFINDAWTFREVPVVEAAELEETLP